MVINKLGCDYLGALLNLTRTMLGLASIPYTSCTRYTKGRRLWEAFARSVILLNECTGGEIDAYLRRMWERHRFYDVLSGKILLWGLLSNNPRERFRRRLMNKVLHSTIRKVDEGELDPTRWRASLSG